MNFMKSLIVPLIVVTLTAFSPRVIGDEDTGAPTTRRELPEGRTVEVDGEQLRAFTPKELAELVKLEDDYLWFFDNWKLAIAAKSKALAEVENRESRLSICKESLDLAVKDRDLLRVAWTDERRLRLEARNAAAVREWIPWALVVVESIAFGVVGVYAAAK